MHELSLFLTTAAELAASNTADKRAKEKQKVNFYLVTNRNEDPIASCRGDRRSQRDATVSDSHWGENC